MTVNSLLHHDWTKVMAIIITLAGLALAQEHRDTKNEDTIAAAVASVQVLKEHQDKQDEVINQIQMNQVRVTTILDGIDRRHSLEDQKRK